MKKVTVNNGANSTNNMVKENKNFKEVKTMKANNNHNNHINSANNANSNNSVNENKIKKEATTMTKKNSNNSNTFNTIVEQPKTYLATTKTGHKIYLCDETLEHMKAHSDVSMEHIKEAIEQNETYQGPFEIRMISLGYIVGEDRCIEVQENDPEVQHLYRKGRAGTTPITFSKYARLTSLITIGICLDQDLKDTLFTAFYGQLAPREPWDPSLPEQERAESEEFWKNHAIVARPDEIDWERSDTKFMPNKQEEKKMDNEDKKMQMSRVLDTITNDYDKYGPIELLRSYEVIIQMETDIYGLCVIPDDDDFRRLIAVKDLIEAALLKKLDETTNKNKTQEEQEMNPINYIGDMTVEELKYLIDYSIEGPDGNMVRHVDFFETETALFNFASRLYAFDDCYDVEVHTIICDHISCKYTGWQHNMLFTYVNTENGEVVWECEYPEFDH